MVTRRLARGYLEDTGPLPYSGKIEFPRGEIRVSDLFLLGFLRGLVQTLLEFGGRMILILLGRREFTPYSAKGFRKKRIRLHNFLWIYSEFCW
jgi:hypothetical protein